MPAMLEVSLIPSGKAGASQSEVVASAIRVIKRNGLKYELSSMGTTIEGDLDTLFRVAKEMHEMCFSMGYPRVQTIIKLDDRRDKDLTMEYRVRSVMEKIGE